MPTVLVSFLGTGPRRSPDDAAGGYQRPGPGAGYAPTTYVFDRPAGPPATFATSLFGAAVLNYLRNVESREVARWIVLGTTASHWSALVEGLPERARETLERAWVTIDDHVRNASITAEHLSTWQAALNDADPTLEFIPRLVEAALDRSTQLDICRALFDGIPPGSDVVFDISHGYRHLPVIAAFAISLMDRTHQLGTIRFFSGVFEARTEAGSPAIELPVCQELLEATAATAILDITGNYAPLADFAGAPEADRSWFFESTFQLANARRPADAAAATLTQRATERGEPVRALAAQTAAEALTWRTADYLQDRLHQRAHRAHGSGDDTRACILAFEALLMAAVRVITPNVDICSYNARHDATDRIRELLKRRVQDPHTQAYHNLRMLRNAVAHGTRPTSGETQAAMANPAAFRQVVADALRIYETWPRFIRELSYP